MDQFKNDLSAAERLTDLVKPPSFDEAPTTARPITPDDWNDDPEDFEAHREYFESVKGRDRWTPAELGALLLPPLKLEMLLSRTDPQDLAFKYPSLAVPVIDAIEAGKLSASERDGRTTIDPGAGISWLLTQVPHLPQEIADLADRMTGKAAQVVPAVKTQPQICPVEEWLGVRPNGWSDIAFTFRGNREVRIKCRDKVGSASHEKLGFSSLRNGKPTQAWMTMREFGRGKFVPFTRNDSSIKDSAMNAQVKKVNKLLKRFFGLDTTPILIVEQCERSKHPGWRSEFTAYDE